MATKRTSKKSAGKANEQHGNNVSLSPIGARRSALNAEYVRLTEMKNQIDGTLNNIKVSLAELDRLEAESKKAQEAEEGDEE